MHWIDAKTILLDRELSELDYFVLTFLAHLQKYTSYVLVSGYVAILLGRSRTTEDVDIFIERIPFDSFERLYKELLALGYWSLSVDAATELFSMLEDGLSIRFAKRGRVIPNIEIKLVKDLLDRDSLRQRITVRTLGGEMHIAPLDMQIAYKRFVLKSQKDLEDARHLQNTFDISEENINKCRRILKDHGRL